MTLSKEEFKVMVMLYAANIDGDIQSDEIKLMLEKTDFDTVEKVEKLFDKMNDIQVIECINENKVQYAATEADKQLLLEDVRAIIDADEKITVMEEQLSKALEKLLG